MERAIEVSVPAFGRTLTLPYAYRGDRYKLIEPVDFRIQDEAAREQRIAWFAVAGGSIFDEADPIVV